MTSSGSEVTHPEKNSKKHKNEEEEEEEGGAEREEQKQWFVTEIHDKMFLSDFNLTLTLKMFYIVHVLFVN